MVSKSSEAVLYVVDVATRMLALGFKREGERTLRV